MKQPGILVFVYFCVGLFWFTSDGAFLHHIFSIPISITEKLWGFTFVVLSGVFIFWIFHRYYMKNGMKEEPWSVRRLRIKRFLIDSIDDLIWSIDTKMKLSVFNAKYKKIKEQSLAGPIQSGDDALLFQQGDDELAEKWKAYYSRALSGEQFTTLEMVRVGGESAYFEINFHPMFENDQIIGACMYGKDVTQRVRYIKDIQAEHLFSDAILSSLSPFICVTDERGNIIKANNAWNAAGFSNPNDFVCVPLGNNYLKFCDKQENKTGDMLAHGIASVLNGQVKEFVSEYSIYENNKEFWYSVRILPLIGKYKGLVITHEDITSRKQNELQLDLQNSMLKKTLEEKDRAVDLFESLFESIPVLIAIYPNELTEFRFNKKYTEILGYTNEDALVMNMVEKSFPDEKYRAEILEFVANYTGVWKEMRVTSKSGEVRIQRWCNIKLKNNTIVGIGIDITKMKQQEQELRTLNDQLITAQKMARLSYWEADLQNRRMIWPKHEEDWVKRLTASATEQNLHRFRRLIHPDDESLFETNHQQALNGNKDYNIEYRLLTPDKNIVWINELARLAASNGSGKTNRLKVTVQDITERKLVEEQYRVLFENAPFPIMVFRMDNFQFLKVNNAAVQKYGYSKEAFLLMALPKLLPEGDLKKMKDFIAAHETHLHESHHLEVVMQHRKKDGNLITVQTIFNQMFYEEKDALFIFAVDLTDQEETEQKITNAIVSTSEKERTEISRELHDSLSQELTIASLNLKNLKYEFDNLKDNSRYNKTLQYLETCIDHVRSVAHRLHPKAIEDLGMIPAIAGVIEDIMEVYPVKIEFDYNKNLRLDQEYELNIYRIIQEALNNIIKHSKAKNVHIKLHFDDQRVRFFIKDDGIGFSNDFTALRDEGVGLRIIRSRITSLGGALKIISSPGEGTRIDAEFPMIYKGVNIYEKSN